MVRKGEADGSVAGAVHTTGEVLRAALACVGPAAGIRTVSSSFYMVVQDFRGRGEEVISFTDAGVVPEPTPQQLSDIAFAAVRARALVVGDEPRVAFLSYSTRGSASGAGVDRVVDGLRLFQDRAPDIPSDGELQADAALVEAVARRKAPDSAVAGLANILVFPDLGAANIAYKLVERLGAAPAVGPDHPGAREALERRLPWGLGRGHRRGRVRHGADGGIAPDLPRTSRVFHCCLTSHPRPHVAGKTVLTLPQGGVGGPGEPRVFFSRA